MPLESSHHLGNISVELLAQYVLCLALPLSFSLNPSFSLSFFLFYSLSLYLSVPPPLFSLSPFLLVLFCFLFSFFLSFVFDFLFSILLSPLSFRPFLFPLYLLPCTWSEVFSAARREAACAETSCEVMFSMFLLPRGLIIRVIPMTIIQSVHGAGNSSHGMRKEDWAQGDGTQYSQSITREMEGNTKKTHSQA